MYIYYFDLPYTVVVNNIEGMAGLDKKERRNEPMEGFEPPTR